MTDRAQSELLGFALVFSIIVVALALITATGFAGLHGAQDHQQTVHIQSAFELFGTNVDDVTEQGVPSRSTEVKLGAGALHVDDSLVVHIESGGVSRSVAVGALVYEGDGDTRIVYESGMAIRENGDGSIGFATPASHGGKATVFRIVNLEPTASTAVGGTTTVLVRTAWMETEVIEPSPNATATIEFETAYPEVWNDHLASVTAASPGCDLVAETTVECQPGHGYVVIDTVEVSFR